MRHRSGQDRQQFGLFATPLDELIAPDKLVRTVAAVGTGTQPGFFVCREARCGV